MYINSHNSFSYAAPQEQANLAQQKGIESKNTLEVYLKNFSEKAQINFDSLSSGLPQEKKNELAQTLNSIGKAAAFSSMNGFDSQGERLVVSQYFGSFEGVLSDDMIKKMILSKLKNPNIENRDFLTDFASSLDQPLQRINISV